jgi:two-component system, OmpR family, phosphate regulon sensor histidine kinase PhoR
VKALGSRFFWKTFLTTLAVFSVLFLVLTLLFYYRISHRIIDSGGIDEFADIGLVVGFFALSGPMLMLVIASIYHRRVEAPIFEMLEVCNAFQKGDYRPRIKNLPNDEIGRLGTMLNRLGDTITEQIETISLDREQLKAMFTGMVEGVIAIDNQTRIRFCNKAAYDILKPSTKDARGHFLANIDGFVQLKDLAEKVLKHKSYLEEDLNLETPNEAKRIEVHASFLERGDGGALLVLHDITHIKKLERIRSDFVANVSHEIKTPLTSIRGYVEILLSEEENDEQTKKRFLGKIQANSDRLLQLVQDILELARIESDTHELELKPLDVNAFLKEFLTHFEDITHAKELQFSKNLLDKPVIVYTDEKALKQVVENLVTNAVRYTPAKGHIQVHLQTIDKTCLIQVQDTGIGIPKKYLGRIFQRFYRVDKARSREAGGTGLGLSIAKHLVSSMQGQIDVQSEVNVGSTFTIRLPLG